jgi:hypothetical protein
VRRDVSRTPLFFPTQFAFVYVYSVDRDLDIVSGQSKMILDSISVSWWLTCHGAVAVLAFEWLTLLLQ